METVEEAPDAPVVEERPLFAWHRFFALAREEFEEAGGTTAEVILKTQDELEGGLACAVLDPCTDDFPIEFCSPAYAKMCGSRRDKTVGVAWEMLQLPDDKVMGTRLNGEEVELLYNFFTAYGRVNEDTRASPLPLVVVLLSERRDGERFWSMIRVSRVVLDNHPFMLLRACRLNMPSLEVLQGLQPSIEAKAHVEELLANIRETVRNAFSGGEKTMSGLARIAEEAVATHLHENWAQSGGVPIAIDEEGPTAPPMGLQAVRDFEAAGIWTSLFSPAEQRVALASEDTAWTMLDLEIETVPLVYMTPQFGEITGYSREWMMGRNIRFLQPGDPGRNEVFNGEENRRVKAFCTGGTGTLTSLVLNQKLDGSFFWNLMVMEWVVFKGRRYILAANKQLTLHQELLSMMNTWDHRSLSYISSLRLLLMAREPHLSPMPARAQANEPMIAECFLEWSENIRQDLSDFWEGDHFVPPIGHLAVQTFEGRWTPLMQKSDEMIRKTHAIQEGTLSCMRDNKDGGIVCCVADPTAPDCPLVFVSKEFESQTGYRREFALGRNCRFLQPNNRQFNVMLNGGEVASMRHFCTLLSDYTVGSTIINLLLNERKGGERFWNLLHMVHVDVAGRRYILGVQTVLDLPMPGFLKTATKDPLSNLPPDGLLRLQDLCKFLSRLRSHLRSLATSETPCIKELSKSMHAEIMEYIKTASDDFEGDHYVPKVGLAEARQFETDRKWARVFSEVATDMKEIFESTEESYENTIADAKGAACCTVADPSSEDCPLLYISTGFEQLTGYHRDWALGRNCRFLQPNAKAFNDAFNLWERSQMREFCQMPPKDHRQLTLLINEARDGYPFWNALVMKHVEVAGHNYVFGVQTNVTKYLDILGELLAGGPDGFRELGRLRAIMRSKSAKLGVYSLAVLVDECLQNWISSLPAFVSPKRLPLPLSNGVRLPGFGVELARTEQQSLEEKVLAALDEGIRHFHLNFAIKSQSHTTDTEGRLFALRVVEALAVLKQRHLHYLRDGLVFSIRAKPCQLAGSLEILNFLQDTGFKASLWLLDISTSNDSIREITDVWPDLDRAYRDKLVEAVGLYGGGPTECAVIRDFDLVKPVVQALDIYVGVQFNCRQWVHVSKLSQSGVVIMTCKPFGPKGSLLSNPQVRMAAKEQNIDPAMLLLKWAEGLGYLCVTPTLRSKPLSREKTISSDLPFVLNGTRRTFVKEYAAAPSSQAVCTSIKRRFPTLSLDHVRNHSTSASADSSSSSPAKKAGSLAFGTSSLLSASSRPAMGATKPAARPKPKAPAQTLAAASRDSGTPLKSTPSAFSSRTPTGAVASPKRRPGAVSPTRGQSPTNSQPSSPGSPAAKRSPGSALARHNSSPVRKAGQSPNTPQLVPRIVLDQSGKPTDSSRSENTDDGGTEMQKKQQELAKREVELMLRELQLEQRLLKEEQRLLTDKGEAKSP